MLEQLTTPFHDWLVELRRHFHQYPELSYQEEKTAAKIGTVLSGMGVPFQSGVGRTGVVASLLARKPGPTIAFRADMDALPLQEQNDVPYRSAVDGVMHACGHDGHITIGLGIIRCLLEQKWVEKGEGKILFFFQPAEEGGAGALAMIGTGILDREPVEAIFAGHMHPELPAGYIGIAPEICNAASDSIHIDITGRGGHGAHPHLCEDPIVAGAYLITEMQSIVSRNVTPTDGAVLTIGRFHAGTASNIIPEKAHLEGTLRTLRPETRERIIERLKDRLTALELGHRVTAALTVTKGYPLLINDPSLVRYTTERAIALLGPSAVQTERPRMGAEDFAYFMQKCPGIMIRIGCHNPEEGYVHGLHSPRFDLDERVLDVGVRLFSNLLTSYSKDVLGDGNA